MAELSQSQQDELEALNSIYGEDFTQNEENSFELQICCDDVKWWAITLSFLLPKTYPEVDPPIFEIFTECLSYEETQNIFIELERIWEEHKGEPILYLWAEKIREMVFEKYEQAKLFIESTEVEKARESELTNLMRDDSEAMTDEFVVNSTADVLSSKQTNDQLPNIISGETITLKKSIFQGHAAIVHTVEEVKAVLTKLKENRKVAQATHNILAYRLTGVNETSFVQDYADDGEVNAGSRLLHLLEIMNVKNILVVVSRWYGGILLGPDRFRLINNAAREVIVSTGAYTPKQEKRKGKKKK